MSTTRSKAITGMAGAALFFAGIGIGAASSGSAAPAAEPQSTPTVTSTVTHEVTVPGPTMTEPAETVTKRVEVPGPTVTKIVKAEPEHQAPAAESEPSADTSGESVAQANARSSAEDYLSVSAFSRSGLIDQLKYEGFSAKDATYGVDALHADWNEQAALPPNHVGGPGPGSVGDARGCCMTSWSLYGRAGHDVAASLGAIRPCWLEVVGADFQRSAGT